MYKRQVVGVNYGIKELDKNVETSKGLRDFIEFAETTPGLMNIGYALGFMVDRLDELKKVTKDDVIARGADRLLPTPNRKSLAESALDTIAKGRKIATENTKEYNTVTAETIKQAQELARVLAKPLQLQKEYADLQKILNAEERTPQQGRDLISPISSTQIGTGRPCLLYTSPSPRD